MRTIVTGAVCLAIVLAVGVSSGCASKPAPTYSASDPAGKAACFAIEKSTEQTIQSYLMAHPEFRMRMNLQAFVDGGVLPSVPTCPAGGDYTWNPNEGGQVWCSIHGNWQ